LTKNDPYPVFTALDPHEFLLTKQKLLFKEPDYAKLKHDRVSLSISPFAQNADRGRNFRGEKVFSGVLVELPDLIGRWNILGLLYGPIPEGQTLPPTLLTALNTLFPGVAPGTLADASKIDPNQKFGFFTLPTTYRKRGLRFELAANIIGGFGLNIQTGVVSLRQTVTAFHDLTCEAVNDCGFIVTDDEKHQVDQLLMEPFKVIADELGINICNFCETSVEEIRLNLFWRDAYELNHAQPAWPRLLISPFFMVSGSVSPGKKINPIDVFAVPFGNNGHASAGFSAGLNFDFLDTIEVGGEVGFTHFFARDIDNFRVPTSEFQSGIFPFATDVRIKPSHNWHFGGKISAYHFLDRLSLSFQYLIIDHCEDKIELKKCDPAFKPEILECLTSWKVKLIDIGITYDISPNTGLGFLWQAPLSQKNAYRSTTVLFSFYATF
jgi:hypothetical protein